MVTLTPHGWVLPVSRIPKWYLDQASDGLASWAVLVGCSLVVVLSFSVLFFFHFHFLIFVLVC
jgi:hypothetical protein